MKYGQLTATCRLPVSRRWTSYYRTQCRVNASIPCCSESCLCSAGAIRRWSLRSYLLLRHPANSRDRYSHGFGSDTSVKVEKNKNEHFDPGRSLCNANSRQESRLYCARRFRTRSCHSCRYALTFRNPDGSQICSPDKAASDRSCKAP